jgi:hypothetical protein
MGILLRPRFCGNRASVNLDPFRASITGDSQLRRFIFYGYAALPGVEAAYRKAS